MLWACLKLFFIVAGVVVCKVCSVTVDAAESKFQFSFYLLCDWMHVRQFFPFLCDLNFYLLIVFTFLYSKIERNVPRRLQVRGW